MSYYLARQGDIKISVLRAMSTSVGHKISRNKICLIFRSVNDISIRRFETL